MNSHVFDPFWAFADPIVQFSSKEKAIIRDEMRLRDVPKNFRLIDLGDIAREAYFVLQGCMRFYYLTDEGKEVTGFIFQEGMFAGSHDSFFSRVPSTQVVETLEDCTLLVLSYEGLQRLLERVPKMYELLLNIFIQRMSHAQRVVASLIMLKPEERYTAYQELYPTLEQRIPQHVLASYMGITPVSLSRIRSRRKG